MISVSSRVSVFYLTALCISVAVMLSGCVSSRDSIPGFDVVVDNRLDGEWELEEKDPEAFRPIYKGVHCMPAIGSDAVKIFVIDSYALFEPVKSGCGYEKKRHEVLQGFLSNLNGQLVLNLAVPLFSHGLYATCGLVEFSEITEIVDSTENGDKKEIKREVLSIRLLNHNVYNRREEQLFPNMQKCSEIDIDAMKHKEIIPLLNQMFLINLRNIHRVIEKDKGNSDLFYETNRFIKRRIDD